MLCVTGKIIDDLTEITEDIEDLPDKITEELGVTLRAELRVNWNITY